MRRNKTFKLLLNLPLKLLLSRYPSRILQQVLALSIDRIWEDPWYHKLSDSFLFRSQIFEIHSHSFAVASG